MSLIVSDGSMAGVKQDWISMKVLEHKRGVVTSSTDGYVFGYIGLLDRAHNHWRPGKTGKNKKVTYERLVELGIKRNEW